MKSPRFAALVAFVLGLCVLFDLGRWTLSALQSSDSYPSSLILWIVCFTVVLASTALSGWLLLRSSTTSGMIVTFSLCGIAIAIIGTLTYYVDAMIAAQALFYHARDANSSLLLSRVGLGFSVGTFVMCVILFLHTIFIRR